MNNLRNKVQLIGHLGAAPVVKEFGKDKKLANFSMATKEVYYNKEGERVTDTQWHNVVCWNKNAEIAEKYLDKGSEIAIEGKLTNDSWEDKEGNKRYTTKIVVNELLMLGGK
ncbi:single-stranded DNA-binding protein [Wenyingzhuangia sp. 2_MG-2023]|uniref:single-stranded DNA-binding protein n=1 Tax=Wenyingzhuangia sp. 2_MG-2023 TaxID=3062639 RepID=UPI0026E3D945|nr:single-stranded DNA-binding protein [Wenyingzhuangia sp. 2_MG-2023]MDO6736773.1 single-stranded DNA-binding protein [Wenyingzhuangia sp. 2_MG-2023]MDO6800932.1 single-stranded DNA-binding protein [Wenyingzhuangia sp. 1_MG-2023]